MFDQNVWDKVAAQASGPDWFSVLRVAPDHEAAEAPYAFPARPEAGKHGTAAILVAPGPVYLLGVGSPRRSTYRSAYEAASQLYLYAERVQEYVQLPQAVQLEGASNITEAWEVRPALAHVIPVSRASALGIARGDIAVSSVVLDRAAVWLMDQTRWMALVAPEVSERARRAAQAWALVLSVEHSVLRAAQRTYRASYTASTPDVDEATLTAHVAALLARFADYDDVWSVLAR